MTDERRLKKTLATFLKLETIAEALYRQHLHAVPAEFRPLFAHFASVEAHHRRLFHDLYEKRYHCTAPRFHITLWGLRLLTEVLHLFGQRAILRFECFIETRAVRDYTAALLWIKDPDVHATLHTILADEATHLPLVTALQQFRSDEEEHIRKMTALLQR